MRIIVRRRLRQFGQKHPTAAAALERFRQIVEAATWRSFEELRQTFRQADQCKVASGRIVQIFNIQGNRYRLIAHIHFDRQCIYIRDFLSHAEYTKNHWKENN